MAGYELLAAGLVLIAAAARAYAVDYTVGDSSGWASGVDYDTWTSDKTFTVGDTLVFQYGATHDVAEVGSADYSACSASNLIQSFSDQNTRIALTKPGTRYFICGSTGHCAGGMKLAVTVSAAAATTPESPPDAPSSPTPSTSTSTTPPSTPTGKTTETTDGANGGEARLVMGTIAGSVGFLGLALMG